MLVNGKLIRDTLRDELVAVTNSFPRKLSLGVVSFENDRVADRFVALKKKFGESIGVEVREHKLPRTILPEVFSSVVSALTAEVDGIVVQLPLPETLDPSLLSTIPAQKDVDVISSAAIRKYNSGDFHILPPVVGAINEIFQRYDVSLEKKRVVIIGRGFLVGVPAEIYFKYKGADTTLVGKEVRDISALTKLADIIVCGAGSPGLLSPDMVKEGVIILDAGVSEQGGAMVGDANPRCLEKSLLFTPTPGGIGPIMVAILFRNLISLFRKDKGEI